KQLLEPVFDRGLLESNFFNGGVLTAEMLQTEQAANRSRHRQLGMAIGAGVVSGYDLRVVNNSPSAPHIEVSAGLALPLRATRHPTRHRDGGPGARAGHFRS